MVRVDSTMFSAEVFTSLIEVAAANLIKDGEAHYRVADTAVNAHDYAVCMAPVLSKPGERKELVTTRGEVTHIKLAEHSLQLAQCNSAAVGTIFILYGIKF